MISEHKHFFMAALRSLGQHKLRSFLSMLGIIFSVVSVILMLAIAEGAKRETMRQIRRLGTNNVILRQASLTDAQRVAAQERLSSGLAPQDARHIEMLEAVERVACVREVQAAVASADENEAFQVLAVTGPYLEVKSLSLASGRPICMNDVDAVNLVCVLGRETAKALGSQGRVGSAIYLEDRAFEVVGQLEDRDWQRSENSALSVRNFNRAVLIPLGSAPWRGKGTDGHSQLSEIIVRLGESSDVSAAAAAINRIVLNNHGGAKDFELVVPQELLAQAERTHQVFNIVLGTIAAISLLVGGIGIMNIMLASVTERTKEIGIRRAIGANRMHISAHFLVESVILTFVGGCVGVLLGGGGTRVISAMAGWPTAMTLWAVSVAVAMAVGVGLASGIYPAIRAARLDPVEALRYE
jgi:putative ABC transport system permease protein